MDLTKEWFAAVRILRQASRSASAAAGNEGGGAALSSAAEAVVGSQWRTPLTPFMQQATELNFSIREMHTFLLHHFLDYVDLHHCLPSKRSLMIDEDKDLIDLEVTSFMTACAAGVDALKALLQRERLRRMEQEAAAARALEDEGQSMDRSGAGGELRPGSRPAHEHAAVTFLFERLKAVTQVAETMQAERHQRATASKARFYGGPAESRREGNAGGEGGKSYAAAADVWKHTPEELEEERLLQESLPAAYGNTKRQDGGGAEFRTGSSAATGAVPGTPSHTAHPSPSPPSVVAGEAVPPGAATALADASAHRRAEEKGGDGDNRRKRQAEQRPGVIAGAASAVRRWGGRAAGAAETGEEPAGSLPAVSSDVLEGENRNLVTRFKNELDDARLVETKMSEISGLMGLFASKVVEQQAGMEHVLDAAVSANDKLVRGGEHLEKAVARGGTFRLFYAWFMFGASFCLLFLHFFNP